MITILAEIVGAGVVFLVTYVLSFRNWRKDHK